MINRQLVRHIDWVLIGILLLNSIIGVAFIYSCSHYLPGNYYLKQIFWIFISLVALFLFLFFDYHFLADYSYLMYGLLISTLCGILVFGKLVAGTKSWIRFPFFQIQPSEITKVVVILVLARYFSKRQKELLSFTDLIISGVLFLLPVFLIALQPDLGTALSFLPIYLGALILGGINKKFILFLLIFSMLFGFVGWKYFLKDYQKTRLTTLVSPNKDPLGAGYHIIQSKIAIGSGGVKGKGYKKGTQSQLRFLPARHTDFIFSVIGEEFGFIGVIAVILAYALFVFRLFHSAFMSRDRVGIYIVFMVSMMITCQFFINVLMTIGFLPIAGIPLPLISYGGSSLLANYLAVSLVLNVKMRRFVNV